MTAWLADVEVTLRDEEGVTPQIQMFGAFPALTYQNSPSVSVSFRLVHDGDHREAFAAALEQAARMLRSEAVRAT